MVARDSSSGLARAIAVMTAALVVWVVAVVTVVVLVVRGGADESPGSPGAPAEAARPVSLEDLAAAGPLVIPRAPFCDRVPAAAVEAALGADVAEQSAYVNGDRVPLSAGVDDVAHEDGCTWIAADDTVARAWVFTPPVTPGRARRLGAQASGAESCTSYDAGGFGDPAAAWSCSGVPASAGHGGLFGDAWLTCTVTTPSGLIAAQLQARADAWCAAVATGARDLGAS